MAEQKPPKLLLGGKRQALLVDRPADGRRRAAADAGAAVFGRVGWPVDVQPAQEAQVEELGDTTAWIEGISPSKIAEFAGEAAAQDAAAMGDDEPTKRLALVAFLVHTARMQARDDLAEMFCKRVAGNLKKAKTELVEI